MRPPRPHRVRHVPPVAGLAAAVAYPVALAFEPGLAWALAVAAATAITAGAGARAAVGRDSARPWPVAAGLLLAGVCGDVLARAALRFTAAAPVDETVLGTSAFVAGGILAGGWVGGHALATRVDEAVEAGMPPGHVKPVGHLLVAGGCLMLAAAGAAQWRAPTGGLTTTLLPVAVVAYAAVAGLASQRIRRAALLAGWRRSGRLVDPAVAGNWGTWVSVPLLAAVAVTSLWWLPPVEPLRRTAEEGSAQAAASFREFFERQRLSRDGLPGGQVTGESMPARGPTPPDVERRTITVREIADWLLQPGTAFEEGEPVDAGGDRSARWSVTPQLVVAAALLLLILLAGAVGLRRRAAGRGAGLVATVAARLAELAAAVAAMFRRRERGPAHGRQPGDRAGADPRASWSRGRRWLRPADPREQVKHDYLRVVDRAARRGVPREPAQSPAEYARVLGTALPDQAGDLQEITGHFVEARYSDHPIGAGTAERTRSISRSLCRELRRSEAPQPFHR